MIQPWQQIHRDGKGRYQPKCPCGWRGGLGGRAIAEKQAAAHGPRCHYLDDELAALDAEGSWD